MSTLVKEERGLTSMEYSVLFVVLVCAAVLAWRTLGEAVRKKVASGQEAIAALDERAVDSPPFRRAMGREEPRSEVTVSVSSFGQTRPVEATPVKRPGGAQATPDQAASATTGRRATSASAVVVAKSPGPASAAPASTVERIESALRSAFATSTSVAKSAWNAWQGLREEMIADEVRYLEAHPEEVPPFGRDRQPSSQEIRRAAEVRMMTQGFVLGPLKVVGTASKGALAGRLLGRVKSALGLAPKTVAPGGTKRILEGVGSKVSQKQLRHIAERPEWIARGKGSYFKSADDAQAVLNAAHGGTARVLGRTSQGHVVVEYSGVTGFNNNPGAGFIDQPTHVFMIKGTSSPSVVPISPAWKP